MRRKKHQKACHFTEAGKSIYHTSHSAIVPVEIVRLEDNSFHMVINVEIEGVRGDMIVDTGASVTVVDRKVFPDKAGEETESRVQSGCVTGEIGNVRIIRVNGVRIGGRKIGDTQVAGIDLDYVNQMYEKHLKRKIIGLLGCDFCVMYKVQIDYREKVLTMHF